MNYKYAMFANDQLIDIYERSNDKSAEKLAQFLADKLQVEITYYKEKEDENNNS